MKLISLSAIFASIITAQSIATVEVDYMSAIGYSTKTAGALCDGSKDDTTPINALLAKSNATIYILGTCMTRGVTAVGHNLLIHASPGSGLKLIPGSTAAGQLINLSNTSNILFDSVTFDGSGVLVTSGNLVAAGNATNLVFRNCSLINAGTSGSGNFQNGYLLYNTSFQIHGGTISNIAGYGISTNSNAYAQISDVEIFNCYSNGINITSAGQRSDSPITISNVNIHNIHDSHSGSGQYGNGIVVYNASDVSITGGKISYTDFTGVRVNAGLNVKVTGVSLSHNGDWGLYSEFSSKNTSFSGNLVHDSLGGGINCSNGLSDFNYGCTITGNTISNTTGSLAHYGFGIVCEQYGLVSNNVVDGPAYYGIVLGYGGGPADSGGCSASNNLIQDTRPRTLTLSSVYGMFSAHDKIYVGSSWLNATKQATVTNVSGSTITVSMIRGNMAVSDSITRLGSTDSATVTSYSGPTLPLVVGIVANVSDTSTTPSIIIENNHIYGASDSPIAGHSGLNGTTLNLGQGTLIRDNLPGLTSWQRLRYAYSPAPGSTNMDADTNTTSTYSNGAWSYLR